MKSVSVNTSSVERRTTWALLLLPMLSTAAVRILTLLSVTEKGFSFEFDALLAHLYNEEGKKRGKFTTN